MFLYARHLWRKKIGASFSKEPLPREWPETIRLVSWNVNRGLHLTEIIEFLAASSADLILLQETDVNARRTRHLNVPREIAEALKMNYVFGREFEELGQGNARLPRLSWADDVISLPALESTHSPVSAPIEVLAAAMVHSSVADFPETARGQEWH